MDSCDVWELARRGAMVEGELAVAAAPRLAAQLADADGSLHYSLVGLVDARGRPAASLSLQGRVRARCDRCGQPVEVAIVEQAQFFFVSDEAELAALPIDDAPDEPLLGSKRFDLQALVEEQAILALPISPRHETCSAPEGANDFDVDADEGRQRPFGALEALKKRAR
jgi:uncharacterized protein